jgi:hypothetical protein
VTNGTLGTLSLTNLPDHRYTLRLTVENTHGQIFRDRIEFVRDTLSDGSSSAAHLACATPVTNHTSLSYGRNYQPTGDRDWFRMELINGETYEFRTLNLTGASDTMLYLYQSNATTVIQSNDDYPSAGLKQSRIQWTCNSTGTYYLRTLSWSGGGFPEQPAIFDVTMTGLFRDAYERDNTQGTATAHTVGTPADHNLVPAGDVDWLSFSATSGTSYTVECTSFGSSTRVELFDTDGSTSLGMASQNSEGYYTVSNWSCPATGTYYVKVDSSSSSVADYTIVVYEAEDFLFKDDFATVGDAFWTGASGSWAISSGAYEQTNTAESVHNAYADVPVWSNFIVDAKVQYSNVTNSATAGAGVILRYDDDDGYILGWIRANGNVEIVRYHNGTSEVLDAASFTSSAGTDYNLRLSFSPTVLNLYVNGRLRCAAASVFFQGPIALHSFGCESRFDDVEVFLYGPGSLSPFTITSAQLADGEGGQSYNETIPTSGGTAPLTISVMSGSLPTGLSLSGGAVTGTPTQLGSWSFLARAVDSVQRVTARNIGIDVYDTLAPSITINSPQDQDVFATSSQTLDVDIADFSALQLTQYRINSGTWTALTPGTGDNFTASLTLTTGSNIIDVRAEDALSQSDTQQIEVFYDSSMPEVLFTSLTDGQYVYTQDVTVTGTFLNCVSVEVNGQPATLNTGSGTWSVQLTLAQEANVLTVTGTDQYSRTDVEQITVHYLMLGDVDRDWDVDADDVLYAARAEAGLETLDTYQMACGDVDDNGTVDIRDAYAIRRAVAGQVTLSK